MRRYVPCTVRLIVVKFTPFIMKFEKVKKTVNNKVHKSSKAVSQSGNFSSDEQLVLLQSFYSVSSHD